MNEMSKLNKQLIREGLLLKEMTYEDLLRMNIFCGLREKNLRRAKLIFIDNIRPSDVAKLEGISVSRIYQVIYKVKRGCARLMAMDLCWKRIHKSLIPTQKDENVS